MQITVVIPTCNRKERLRLLLGNLNQSSISVEAVIIIDAGEDKLFPSDYLAFERLKIHYFTSGKSVCVQRNIGIRKAQTEWIFLCDDDVEVPSDYLEKLILYAKANPDIGALSGFFLQKENARWTEQYPVTSSLDLFWRFIFQLSIWGEIKCKSNFFLTDTIKSYYQRKGNHISKAGWPVITEFSKDHFTTPLYSLGASLVKKKWLIDSPFDEALDSHGIGDNYGVALGFPEKMHILKNAFVYHHREPINRLAPYPQYERRVLALDYFISTKRDKMKVRKIWFLWSLTGNLIYFIIKGKGSLALANLKAMIQSMFKANPYLISREQAGIILK